MCSLGSNFFSLDSFFKRRFKHFLEIRILLAILNIVISHFLLHLINLHVFGNLKTNNIYEKTNTPQPFKSLKRLPYLSNS